MIVSGHVTTADSLSCGESHPLCPVALRCGGCPRIAEPSELQRADKASYVQRLLTECGVPISEPATWITGPKVGYRNRIRLAVIDGVPRFFNAEKTLDCVVLEASLQTALSAFLTWAGAYTEALKPFRVAEVRASDADGVAAVYLRHTERNGARGVAPNRSALPHHFAAGIVAFEDGPVSYQRMYVTSDVWLWSPVGGFGQINTLVNQRMVQTVVQWLAQRQATTFLDLFAGSGNFSVPLRGNGLRGTAVEWDVGSCQAHERTLQSHAFDGVRVLRDDALSRAERLLASGERFDAVVADPPRRGLRGEVGDVVALARQSVVLVSCSAQHFANDAAALCARGFRLAEYRLVDMFPHTNHVEIIACFDRT